MKGRLPPAVKITPGQTVAEYTRDRLRQHTYDSLEQEGTNFTVRSDMELYGVTAHPGGFLERTG